MAGKIVTTSNLISAVLFGVLDPQEPVGDHDTAGLDVDLDDRIPGRRDQVFDRAFAADPDVVRRALKDLLDHPQAPARAGQHGEADDLVVVELAGFQRTDVVIRNLQVAASEQLRHGSVLDAAELHHETRLAFAAPLDLVSAPVEQQAHTRVETILEICQGDHLDSSFHSKRPRNLSDSGHAVTSPLGRLPLPPRGENCWPAIGAFARSTKTRLRSRDEATRTSVRTASLGCAPCCSHFITLSASILTFTGSVIGS